MREQRGKQAAASFLFKLAESVGTQGISFVVSVVLGSIVWGISEIINLHAQQIDIQLRLEEKLRKLVPETPVEEKPVEFCAHCGTQLPPGGKTCPSCHEVNQ